MKTCEFISYTEKATKTFAAKLAAYIQPGDVITLSGDLGAGKTTFTKGLAEGLEIKRPITSPTFTIIKEYQGKMPLYHMDAYRLEHSDEDIGFEEYFFGEGISVVEWACFIEEYLPKERLVIDITQVAETTRELKLTAIGNHFEDVLTYIV